ncbi:DNA primase large subunit [Halovenus aranensis]|uniref:DNA primase large subunit PriL n=1 Tax=Halovenus aranensis TaxID=890420 RepID=A0A1G8VEV1_9EURY|nr:DNA primase regulatory subunit PriL [Halovenus aranensis]SDJ63660.1 DNA primase large subunit [Halovenus aranensis]
MKQLHARYPFLQSAREAVEAMDVAIVEIVQTDETVVERAIERIETALDEGVVGEPHRRDRVELLSYPVARVIVSLVDEHALTRKYANAEARTAQERLEYDRTQSVELKSTQREQLTVETLLSEFDIEGAVRETPAGYAVDVGTYLDLAADKRGDEWRLVNRKLSDGEVTLESTELLVLIRQAVKQRIDAGLPLAVPDEIAAELDGAVRRVNEALADLDLMRDIDTVVPELFPPCMRALLDDVQKGEHLEHHSRFAIASFLTSIGMTTDEIVDLFQVNPGFGEEATRYQVDHIRGDTSPTEYSTPSCATMQSYGDCVNMDDLCETIAHPMAYYEAKLDDADEDELVDWREAQAGES